LSFAASAGFAFIATIAALFSKGKGLQRGSSA
jgi:hypothetical protein